MNHNDEIHIWHLWEVTSRYVTPALSQIRRQLLIALPSLLPSLPNLTGTFLQKHLNPLSPNPFSIMEIFQTQPGLESLQKISDRRRPVQGSFLQLFQTVLSPDHGLMLLLVKPSHPYFLPLAEGTDVTLPHAFGQLLQGEFCSLQADWGFALGPAQV